MTTVTISIIIAAAIYVIYNIFALKIFGVPESLSNTYYLYKDKWHIGFIFPIMMYLVTGFMMPAWITLSEGSVFQFLSFLAPAGIAFVGTSPAFKSSSLENKVHTWSAYFAAAFSLAWVILVTPFWWTILIWLGVFTFSAILTKTYKTSLVYWLEQIAFGATFTSAILFGILL